MGGIAGTGKTALAAEIATAALRAHPDLGVFILSLDLTKDELYERLLCREAAITGKELAACRAAERFPEQVDEAAAGLRRQVMEAKGRLHAEVLVRLRVRQRSDLPARVSFYGWLDEQVKDLIQVTDAFQVFVVID